VTDRRTTIKWMLGVAASLPLLGERAHSGEVTEWLPVAKGYGGDPKLTNIYAPGEVWPLTLSAAQRRTAAALCNTILPGDARSPSAESLGLVDFIDEWASAPYPRQLEDRPLLLEGLAWMDAEALLRFEKYFAELDDSQRHAICDDICYEPKAAAKFARAAKFFSRYRDLTVGGYYSTPVGHQDLGYIGNVPQSKFEGPPLELLRKLGLATQSS
jgi:Gluconate 2-dehydrogenase subunit 3